MTFQVVHDATHANIGHLPGGMAAGYTTGTGVVPWTSADWKAHPNAVRIDQDPAASDPTADVLDVENGAATPADAPVWVKAARADILATKRTGQRKLPVIYTSLSNVTSVVNALIKGGVTSGVGLWVASWTNSESKGEQTATDTGPFPIVACQYENNGTYDSSVFDTDWLNDIVEEVRMDPYHVDRLPPGWWQGIIVLSGMGTDGQQWHSTTVNGRNWSTPRRS